METKKSPLASPFFAMEMLAFTIIVVSAFLLGWQLLSGSRNWGLIIAVAVVLMFSGIILATLLNDPD
ncbi:MAG: hypothetical protein IKD70_02630, partial [Eggerthellaceae bacterium]|nr:hypothetical protein [Eggerthellaceae bacterium]